MVETRPLPLAQGEGDLEFEDFFDQEFRRLAKAMYLVTGDPAEAEDITQEAFTRAYERWERVRKMDSPAGWLFRVAFNLNRRRFRRRAAATAPGPQVDPSKAAEDRLEVAEILRSLSREQREALVLVEWLGYPPEEAGRVLGITATAIRTRLHRARSAAEERFGGEHA